MKIITHRIQFCPYCDNPLVISLDAYKESENKIIRKGDIVSVPTSWGRVSFKVKPEKAKKVE